MSEKYSEKSGGEAMEWKITDDRPIWMQLSEQLAAQIAAGAYRPGERLPSVRECAAQAGVNPNTMQRAMADLESQGLVITNRTAGRCVTQDMEKIKKLRSGQAREQAVRFLEQMGTLGYTKEEIRQVLEEALESMTEEGEL
ncbi:transcriptional regulator, GntR family [Clostridium sp. M62/1]|uniref:GntR family transcriptional regulator n=2 Tax=Clostridium sp. M62/1 TaxID=411486 RepID=UPI00019736B5|nr:GntR family transcriptional regulator [Clostridium sp. M62/1]EFE13631.1 transcriptional regulator, GntR family [Clostridium sp. M62/1]